MIKTIVLRVSILLTVGLFVGCGREQTPSSDYMILEDVQYVQTFPQTFSLDDQIEVDLETSCDIIGVIDFLIYDSLLILATTDREGLWSFISLPDYIFLGKFLTIGQGPYEFNFPPYVGSNARFFREQEKLFVIIYPFYQQKLYKMNVDESIKNNKLNIYTLNDALPLISFNFAMLDNTTFFIKEIVNSETQNIRYILDNGRKVIPPHFEKMNLAKIKEGEDINILSTIAKYDFERNLIVEMPVGLNYINTYSIDGSFGKTICIGNRLDHIGKIQTSRREDRIHTFGDIRLFSKFWGVLFINEDYRTNLTERQQLPEILLFDWFGKPLAKLKLNIFITSFDIDFTNGYLYTLDDPTDKMYKYNIREILEEL